MKDYCFSLYQIGSSHNIEVFGIGEYEGWGYTTLRWDFSTPEAQAEEMWMELMNKSLHDSPEE